MLQKILVILIGLIMSLVGSLSPEGLFASQESQNDPLGLAVGALREETLATVRAADKAAFARVPILWAEVDGKRVVEDAWGTGEVKDLRFKVGVKDVEGTALLVGERQVDLQPTDVLTVRMFRGDFSFRGIGTPTPTLQLQGEVKTTTLSKGESGNRLLTQVDGGAVPQRSLPADGRVAYVVLTTGEKVDTVAVEEGGARLFTEEATDPAQAKAEPGNLLAKWVRIDGRMVREYTWGEGTLDTIEFEPAEGTGGSVVVAYNGKPTGLEAGARATVKDFVGEYLVYQVANGHLRLRLDGYAGDYLEGAHVAPPTATSGPGAPIAAFDFSPANPKTTDVVRFRDLSIDEGGEVVLRKWDFGDGSADVRKDPTHRFEKPGVYEVTLDVTDIDVLASQVKRTITVRNAEPQADFEFAPKRIYSGSLVTFTDLSRDVDGSLATWSWEFGDGETSTARHPVHRFTRGGNHTVTLTVGDDLQGQTTVTKTVAVLNTPPRVAFAYAPDLPLTAAPVQFFDNSSDVDGEVVSWEWDFGDGGTARGPTPSYAFAKPGTFTVRLTVTDNAGGSTTLTQSVVVQNRPPLADFVWTPMGQPADRPVEFRSTSVDPDGLVLLTSWDFGDGTTGARDSPVHHIFPRAGTYNVTVTVTDNFLATASLTRSVTIANAAPRADFSMAPDPTFRGVAVNFTDMSRDPDGDPVVERVWDFGDGTPATDTSFVASHVFTSVGTFPVTLRVKDVHGNAGFATRPLQVLNRPPTGAFTLEPGIPVVGQPIYLNATGLDPDSPGDLTFRWTFPNGTVQVGQRIEATFGLPGPQTVVLRVLDSEGGQSGSIARTFQVDLSPPTAAFTVSDLDPETGDVVEFNDVSLSPNGAIRRREWTIQGVLVGASPTLQHAFEKNGTHMVTLYIEDGHGSFDYHHQNVSVNGRPIARFDAPVGVQPLNQPVLFKDRSTDPDGRPMSYRWDFDDGSSPSFQRGDVTHKFLTPGPKNVTLTVTDDKGVSATDVRVVEVFNRRPVARWDLGTTNPQAGQTVSFLSTGRAFDPDGPDQIKSWSWSFGEGGTSSAPDPTNVFPRSGLYTVNLQVSDGMLKSAVEPGAYKLVRIGADHPVTVTVVGKYPDGRRADLLAERFALTTQVGQPATGFTPYAKSDYLPNASALDLRLEAGSWLEGEQVVVTLRDKSFMTFPLEKVVSLVESDGLRTSVTILFEIPLPLEATLAVDPGSAYALLPVMIFRNETSTEQGEPIYRSPVEQFHGTGRVTFRDGVPVEDAAVTLYARYVPTAVVATAQDAADLGSLGGAGLLGWCKAAEVFSDEQGDYEWAFAGANCLSSAAGLYPVGRWEVRAVATFGWAGSDATGVERAWVDPTGGDLANLPLP